MYIGLVPLRTSVLTHQSALFLSAQSNSIVADCNNSWVTIKAKTAYIACPIDPGSY
ncbi:hypothetical protein APV28_2993 [Comamonas testosteroni]|nr:hypothetical protein APV28_2993 [Comamonas testosteroni]